MTGSSSGRRPKRVAGLIQDTMSRVFIQEVQPLFQGLITVTRVEMPPDLKSAKVYLTVLGADEPARILETIRQKSRHYRKILASTVNLKYNPELFFFLDPVPEYESRIDDLIARLKKNDEPQPD